MFKNKGKRLIIAFAICLIFCFSTVEVAAMSFNFDSQGNRENGPVEMIGGVQGGVTTGTSRDESLALLARSIGIAIGNGYSQGTDADGPNSIAATPTTTSDPSILAVAGLALDEVKKNPPRPNSYLGGDNPPTQIQQGSGEDTYSYNGDGTPTSPPTIHQSPITVSPPSSDQLSAQLQLELEEMPGGKACIGGDNCYSNPEDSSSVAQPISDGPPRHGW